MFVPYFTIFTRGALPGTAYCASDLVFQTGAIVIDSQDRVLLVDQPHSHRLALPRSPHPHSLDNLTASPLGFLPDVGCTIEPLPLCRTFQNFVENTRWPVLGFEETVTTDPFAISLDIAYLVHSYMRDVPDNRQSVVWWYSAILRGECQDLPGILFLPIKDAIQVIQGQRLYDVVAVCALELFRTIWDATKRLPRQLDQNNALSRIPTFVRHPEDEMCYPISIMHDDAKISWTSWTMDMTEHAFWPAADYFVQTGIILIDKRRELIYMVNDSSGKPSNLPRGSGNNFNELMRNPLAAANIKCDRLALPELGKQYTYDRETQEWVPRCVLYFDTTTNPFDVTFYSHWVGSLGRGSQAIIYWFAGCFDAEDHLGNGSAVTISEATEILDIGDDETIDKGDQYASRALDVFTHLWRVLKSDD